MTVRPPESAAGSLVLLVSALAPARFGTESVYPVELGWGGAPEPALHRLQRDWVGEAHERDARNGAPSPRR